MLNDYIEEIGLEYWDIEDDQKVEVRLCMAHYALDALHDSEVAKEALRIVEEQKDSPND